MNSIKKTLLSVIFAIATLVAMSAISNFSVSAQTTTTSTTSASPTYICGDVDKDGKISIADATLVQRFLAKYVEFDEIQLKLAECDSTKDVQVSDVTYIQRYIAKIAGDYPVNPYGYKIGDTVTFESKAVLLKGDDFNKAISEFTDYNTVIFSEWKQYDSFLNWEDGVFVDEKSEGTIRAFKRKDDPNKITAAYACVDTVTQKDYLTLDN